MSQIGQRSWVGEDAGRAVVAMVAVMGSIRILKNWLDIKLMRMSVHYFRSSEQHIQRYEQPIPLFR
ncbi:hypothetical protein WI84_29920 [Burkholderia ubonensis]|nr:hypothetical protein WI84_29920 [Burkholderia ubonensis]KVQ85117.1 hypothetical protein WK06_08500 [Burkholderia ubonensis]KVW36808.1 hypothetical protein WK93_27000 [Burkholderia ubonensis]KVZ04629.1 hypothetical protein WL12_14875 [Burkholderia ubonensis]KWB19687.1 hypothetical protein WL33_04620 [Burkholderia ubonensis]